MLNDFVARSVTIFVEAKHLPTSPGCVCEILRCARKLASLRMTWVRGGAGGRATSGAGARR